MIPPSVSLHYSGATAVPPTGRSRRGTQHAMFDRLTPVAFAVSCRPFKPLWLPRGVGATRHSSSKKVEDQDDLVLRVVEQLRPSSRPCRLQRGRGTPSQRLPRSRLATSHRDRGFTTASTPADAAARMAPICSAAMSGRKLLGTDERLRSLPPKACDYLQFLVGVATGILTPEWNRALTPGEPVLRICASTP